MDGMCQVAAATEETQQASKIEIKKQASKQALWF